MSAGTFAYGTAAGTSFGIAVIFLAIAARRPQSRSPDLTVSFLGFAGAAATISHLQLQTTDDVEQYASILKGSFALTALLTIVSLMWVVGSLTGVGVPGVPLTLSAGAVIVACANLFAPGGLIVDDVRELRRVAFLGEDFVLHEPDRSSWRIVLDLYLLVTVSYIVVAVVRSRHRHPGHVRPLGIGLGLATVALLHDSLVDEAIVDTPYIAPFGVLALTGVLGLHLGSRLGRAEHEMLAHTAHLGEVVSARTESLRIANHEIRQTLRRERVEAETAARLTRHLMKLSALRVDEATTGALERSLADTLGCLGELVGASEVHLELTELDDLGVGPASSRWRDAPDDRRVDRHGTMGPAPDSERELVVGEQPVGTLTIWSRPGHPLSDAYQIDLWSQYLAVALHRMALEHQLVTDAVDEERQRIARDLHDSVSQRLYAIGFHSEALAATVAQDPEPAATARNVRTLVQVSLAEMRTLLFELQPRLLSDTTMTTLVTDLCNSIATINGPSLQLEIADGPSVPPEPKLALYRIVQEALTNALRHADASTISVSVELHEATVTVSVRDDGIGFDPRLTTGGHGLGNMARRAGEIDAVVDIDSEPGRGSTVAAVWKREHDAALLIDLTRDGEVVR